MTGRTGSHARTRANIAEAVRRAIPVRAAVINVVNGQRVKEAIDDLRGLGVDTVGTDWVRGVGRGTQEFPNASQLCGRCGRGKAAIGPDGDVWPCVIGRWMRAGNVKRTPLVEIISGDTWRDLVGMIPALQPGMVCNPECKPAQGDGSDCAPAETEACNPSYCEPD
ncbi:SPASM domain-containing protein [Thermopolyspora sp. NPDC052614]|uniref:SPASM domain-containing protein n=1 Tax=Thermopolyspora sp. NPDC052614 TaxID=3155682 RepID=UPI00342FD655